MAKSILDRTTLEMALVGYEAEKARVAAAIVAIQAQLRQRGPGRQKASPDESVRGPRKRVLSAAAKKRIAAAQRKRWAAFHKQKAKAAKPKRRLSEAGRKAIVDALKKRWAAKRGAAA